MMRYALAAALALGALAGWLLGKLAQRRQIAEYAEGMEAGDVLVVVGIPEDELREVEDLFNSYGARAIASGTRPAPAPDRQPDAAPPAGA